MEELSGNRTIIRFMDENGKYVGNEPACVIIYHDLKYVKFLFLILGPSKDYVFDSDYEGWSFTRELSGERLKWVLECRISEIRFQIGQVLRRTYTPGDMFITAKYEVAAKCCVSDGISLGRNKLNVEGFGNHAVELPAISMAVANGFCETLFG
jgi:hypothetical protein